MTWDFTKFASLFSRRGLSGFCLIAAILLTTGCMTENKGKEAAVPPGIVKTDLPLLFAAQDMAAPEPARTFPEEKRIRMAEVAAGMAAGSGDLLIASKQFIINLFDDVRLVAEVDRSLIQEPGRFTLNGHLVAVDGSYFIVTFNQGSLSATVFHPSLGYYEIEATGGLTSRVSEFDPIHLPRLTHGMLFPDSTHHHDMSDTTPMPMPKSAGATPVIDILVVYTPAAAAGSGGEAAMLSKIDKAVAEVNNAFINSQINAKVNLVRAQQINYTEATDMGTDLGRLQNKTDGFMDDVHALRDTYKADVVSLVVEASGGGVAGIGYVMTSVQPWFKDYAFTVVGRAYTGSYNTLAHELGHNFGCAHDRQNSTSQAAYPYSYGYRFNGSNGVQYRDIMAYAPGTPIPYYSNPNVQYMGVATGIADGQANSADNARTINATAPVTEAFYVRPAGNPPVPVIVTPVAGSTYSGGMVVAFSGTGTDPEDGNLPVSALTWRVDFIHDGQTNNVMPSTPGIASGSFTAPNRGEKSANSLYRVYLTVKDASGLSTTTSRDVQPIKANITLASNPPGLQLKLDGQSVTTPYTVSAVAGMIRSVEAVSPQASNGSTYAFGSWSDGGAATHEFTTAASATTLSAVYAAGGASGWTDGDIGTVGIPGSFSGSGSSYTVKASGADIWNTADGFHYGYQTLNGDGMITARVAAFQNTHEWAMAGVMIRENTTAGSRHAFMAVSISHGATLHTRVTADASSQEVPSAGAAPYWVRLVRSGTSLKGYASTDGVTWTLRGESIQSLPQNVLIGLAVTSHDNGVLNTTTFDNVSIVPDAWKSADVGSVLNAGSAAGYSPLKVVGDGADIWGNADGFFYRYRSLSGDGEIKVRVTGVQNTDAWAKAGVMIRETLAAGSKHASMFVTSGNGLAFQRREANDGISLHVAAAGASPSWVKLVRAGNLFTAYGSADGVTWNLVGSATMAMGTEVLVGLAVTSHHNGTPNTSSFDQLTITD
ncbi:MAG: domain containing protein [Fibrobacteres bacterium]|nr:domain containing protein [Fibrobacterota bacterium]